MISQLLLNKSNHLAFLEYYHQRNERNRYKAHNKIEVEILDRLARDVLEPGYAFSVPKLIYINKMASQKRREVFLFNEHEQLFLKYLNYTLNQLQLPIHDQCFSFQPRKGIRSAIDYLLSYPHIHQSACIKVDIKNYFNSIPTGHLEQWMPGCIKEDNRIFSILKEILKNPNVMHENALVKHENKGVMAGMPLAPTLSNLYLKNFDTAMSQITPCYARYSDDMIMFCPKPKTSEVLDQLKMLLDVYGLTINSEKTTVYEPGTPWSFLGIQYHQGKIDLSDVTVKKIKGKISRSAKKLYRWRLKKDVPVEIVLGIFIKKFNRKFYGCGAESTDFTWSKWYFPIINSHEGLKDIDNYFQQYARYLSSGRFQKKNYRKVTYEMLKEAGYLPLVSGYYQYRD